MCFVGLQEGQPRGSPRPEEHVPGEEGGLPKTQGRAVSAGSDTPQFSPTCAFNWTHGIALLSAASGLATGTGSVNSISFAMYKAYIYSPAQFYSTINIPQRYINPIRS